VSAAAPVIEELAREYQGRVTFAKPNTDRGERTTARYGIMAIPMLIVFRGGREVTRLLGVQPKTVLERAIAGALGAPAPAPP
jgi:thioredoxin 1